MTLEQKRAVVKIHDKYITPEIEKKRRALWTERFEIFKKYGRTSEQAKQVNREYYDNLMNPLLDKIDSDVEKQGIFKAQI